MIADKNGDVIRNVEAILIDDFKTTKTGSYLYSVKEPYKYFSKEISLWGEGNLIFATEKKCKKGEIALIDCIIKRRANELTVYPLKCSLDNILQDLHRRYKWLKLKKELDVAEFALKISQALPFYCWFNHSLIITYFEEAIRLELINLSAKYCNEKLQIPLFPKSDYTAIIDIQVKRTYSSKNECAYKIEFTYEPFTDDYFFSLLKHRTTKIFYAKRAFGNKGESFKLKVYIDESQDEVVIPVYNEFYELSVISSVYNGLQWMDHDNNTNKANVFFNQIVQRLPRDIRHDEILLKAYSLPSL